MPAKFSAGIGKGSPSTCAYMARYWRSGAAKGRGAASPGRTYGGGAYEGSGSDQLGRQKKRKQSWADALPILERTAIVTQIANRRWSIMSNHALGLSNRDRRDRPRRLACAAVLANRALART